MPFSVSLRGVKHWMNSAMAKVTSRYRRRRSLRARTGEEIGRGPLRPSPEFLDAEIERVMSAFCRRMCEDGSYSEGSDEPHDDDT